MNLTQHIEWLKAEYYLTDCMEYKIVTREKLIELGVYVEPIEKPENVASRFMDFILGR